jgi:hypothetical protein
MLRVKDWIGCMPSSHLNSNMNEEAYMKLFMDWATIFIENGISNPKEINKTWICSTNWQVFWIRVKNL